jgi:predicted AlkP superfamily phosphohydrolase/phosphomutase
VANRVLIVGWDGADWEILDPLLAAGELPNLAALIDRGRKGVSRSCLPSHSWAAWPTFLTGRDPAGHGVFDILEYRPGATRRLPVSSRSILAPTWPSQLTDAGRTSLIVNVPLTYPAPDIKGVAIAGGVIPQGAPYSHPPEAGPDLGWPINGGSWTTFRGKPLELLADVEDVTRRRADAMRRLMDEQPWDAACMVFVSPDRIQHCLLEYVHPGHPDYATASQTPVAERVIDVYRLLDRELGTLVERTDADDLVLLMSDHGHQPVTRALNMNRVLESLGALRMGRGSALVSLLAWGRIRSLARVAYDRLGLHGKVKVPTTPIDWAHTTAYTSVTSTGEGVSIALAGREPQGTVPAQDYERVRTEVADALLGFVDPATGRHPIARVVRKEDVLHGTYLDRAPDLLLEPAPLYSLTHARQIVEPADWLSGDHRPEGVYVAAGPGIAPARARRSHWPTSPAGSRARWASRSRPARTPPSSRRWACSRTTRSARSRSGSAVSAISTDPAIHPQRGLPGHHPSGRHSRESTPSRTAATRNSTNDENTITAPMAHHPFRVWNGGDRRPVRNTMPT